MSIITGYLSEFSLPEVLQFLQSGQKTGLLAVQLLSEPEEPTEHYFLWLCKGRIVSATNRLDNRCFATLLCRQKHVTAMMINRLIRRCPLDLSLGTFLCAKGVLDKRELKVLFKTQVIEQVCGLFQLPDGCFQFDPKAPLPKLEMTGLSIPATDVTLPGLRALKNWDALQDKLPAPGSGLRNLVKGRPNASINQVEWNVWNAIDGQTSLITIARRLHLPIEDVQKIAFRLMVTGLAEEVPMLVSAFQTEQSESTEVNGQPQRTPFELAQPFGRAEQQDRIESQSQSGKFNPGFATALSRLAEPSGLRGSAKRSSQFTPKSYLKASGRKLTSKPARSRAQTSRPKVSQNFLSSLMAYLRRLPKSS